VKTTSQKNAFGNGYGINRNLKGSSHLTTAIPPHSHVTVSPGLGKQMPGSPKTGLRKPFAKKPTNV
jgi:hypothetical protein